MSILLFLIILVVLIVSHEFGHFIVAKLAKIRVDEFAFGFPPRLWSVKMGETEYAINALPFGGYVKIFGENPDEESLRGPEHARSLVTQPKWIQAAVISAGVVFNILLAWLLLSLGFMIGFPTALGGSDFEKYAKDTALTITSVIQKAPADIAGLKPGDKIISVSSGKEILAEINPETVKSFIENHGEKPIGISYARNESRLETLITPSTGVIENKAAIGISMDMIGIVRLPVHKALWEGANNTYFLLDETARGLYGMIRNAVMGQGSLAGVTGPVGIVKMVGDASSLGFIYLIGFTALISINLAIVNLIPIPALDGGRLLFIIIEAVKGSPIKPKVANVVNAAGFALLMILMVVVTYNDVVRLFIK
ncbi:MAG: RIP metalloprotease RseP [Candidatus Paceibacterota bacterium]|jgi:regulator of sigma E protease